MGRDARARALQLPAWNEALGLPRPWDQQWSLRIQQILAFETDLLDYPDIFEGSKVMDGLVDELVEAAGAEMAVVEEHGGAVEAVDYMKTQLWSRTASACGGSRAASSRSSARTSTRGGASPLQTARTAASSRSIRPSRRPSRRCGVAPARDQAAVDAALDEAAEAARRRARTSCPPRSPPPRRV